MAFAIRGLRGLLGVLFFALSPSGICFSEQQIRADWMETLLSQSQTVRHYQGGVAFYDSLRGVRVSADSASVRVQDAWYAFLSGVVFSDSTREVRADSLVYRQNEDLAEFSGHVVLKDARRRLKAAKVTYRQADRLLWADGRVVLSMPEDHMTLTASRLQYDAASEKVWATGGPGIDLAGAAGDTLVMRADSLLISNDPLHIALNGHVVLQSGGTGATAESAVFTDTTLVLRGRPEGLWRRTAVGDSSLMLADQMVMRLRDRRIYAIGLIDSVEIRVATLRDSLWATHRVTADSAWVDVHGDTLRHLAASGRVNLAMRDGRGNVGAIAGDRLGLAFAEGEPDSMVLSGNGIGEFAPHDSASVSRFSGKIHRIWFEDGCIGRMAVHDQAVCDHRPRAEGRVNLSGDVLRLVFRDGRPEQISVTGGVRGTYLEKSKAGSP